MWQEGESLQTITGGKTPYIHNTEYGVEEVRWGREATIL